MRRAAGGENQLADFVRMIESEDLCDSTAHGMAADDRSIQTEMIEHRPGVFGEDVGGVFARWLAGETGAPIIERNDPMVTRKLRRLIEVPHRAVAGGLAQK
jgi:hypothetical protein